VTNNPERCSQLHKLHTQLTIQIHLLKENMQKEEREGVDSSIESLNTLKVLQSSLSKVVLELEQCPPAEAKTTAHVPDAKSVRFWYPEEERAQEAQSINDEDE
jgi:D-aminopeptidase